MNMSIAEIYEKLGLREPIKYARKRVRENLKRDHLRNLPGNRRFNEINRSTGRTTYMLVHAMQQLADGQEIVVNGRCILAKAQDMASRLDLDTTKILTLDMYVRSGTPLYDDRVWSPGGVPDVFSGIPKRRAG